MVAVPVTVKMLDLMMAPIPRKVRLQGPRVFLRRRSGSSDDAISSSILLVRIRDAMPPPADQLALTLALNHLLDFALGRAPRNIGGSLGFGRGFLAGRALQLLAFICVRDVFGVHSTLIPAYFAISFFSPYPGKLTVIFVSSPVPSRRITVPRPYLACST